MWFPKTRSRFMRIFKSSTAVDAPASERCSPAVRSLRMVLERDDKRRASRFKGNGGMVLRFGKDEAKARGRDESRQIGGSGYGDGGEGGLLVHGNVVEEEEGVTSMGVGISDDGFDELMHIGPELFEGDDDGFDELMHIGPELFEGDRMKDVELGGDRLDMQAPLGIIGSITSKARSVQHWIDNMEAMENHRGSPERTITIGDDHRYPDDQGASCMAEDLAHDCVAEQGVLPVIEESDEMDSSEDDDMTVITAFEFPIGNGNVDLETQFHGDSRDKGWDGGFPVLLETLDEPDLPATSLEEKKPIAAFTINRTTSQSPTGGAKPDPVTAMITDLTPRKARCIPVTPPHRHLGTQVWSGGSPTLLEIQDKSAIPDDILDADEPSVTLKNNQEGDRPIADSRANDSVAMANVQTIGTKDLNTENKTTTKTPNTEDLCQARIVNDTKAKKRLEEIEEEVVPPRARTMEDVVAQAKEKLASLFRVSAGHSHTEEIKIGRTVETQTTKYGQAVSTTNTDSETIAVGVRNASKMAATVQSTPISLETTQEAWLVVQRPNKNAYISAFQAIIDQNTDDIYSKMEASRVAFRARLEQEMIEFDSRVGSHRLEELEAEKAQLMADYAILKKKSAEMKGEMVSSRK